MPDDDCIYTPVLTPSRAAPDTALLLDNLGDLQLELEGVAKQLNFDLLETPVQFLTPLPEQPVTAEQQIAITTGTITADLELPLLKFTAAQASGDCPDLPELQGDPDSSMAGLQVALLGASNNQRWDGAQGPSYWRKRPTFVEALASQRRARGGYMLAADQIGVIRNLIEPVSGAAAWYEKTVGALNADIAAAHNGVFPSATLTDAYAEVALGHLAKDDAYVSALQQRLSKALPADAIAAAQDYMPSRASGVLVLAKLAKSALSAEDSRHLSLLRMELQFLLNEGEQLAVEYVRLQEQLSDAQELRLAAASKLEALKSALQAPAAAPAAAATAAAPSNAQSVQASTATSGSHAAAASGTAGSGASGAALPTPQPPPTASQLQQELQDAETALQAVEAAMTEVKKDRARNSATTIQTRQQMKDYESATTVQSADLVKAFLHPDGQSRICTAHDCIMLKLFATMDVVFGISTELQQIKFSELQQGKGSGVPAEESVREFAARVDLHVKSALNMDPNLAHVQFFSGLADKEIAAEAERVLQNNPSAKLDLDTALHQVQLIEHRRLNSLVLRAANGDTQAAAELKRKAAGSKKPPTKTDASKDDSKAGGKRFHPNPNHPDAKCMLPGHDKGKGHSNRECRQGGSAQPAFAMANAATAAAATTAAGSSSFRSSVAGADLYSQYPAMHAYAAPYAASSAGGTHAGYDLMAQYQQAAEAQRRATEEMSRLSLHFAHAANPRASAPRPPVKPIPPPRGPAAAAPSAHGNKCNICGYFNGHGTGFCYYEYPDKRPDWRPSVNAPPHLINHWRQRRQQLGLPPLDPKPPTGSMAALAMPYRPALPAPSAPPLEDGNSTGHIIALPAIAHFDFPAADFRSSVGGAGSSQEHLVAAMPRSFLQYPPGWHPDHQYPVSRQSGESAQQQQQQPVMRAPAASSSAHALPAPRGSRGAFKRLRYCDEADQRALQQAQTAEEEAAAIAALAQPDAVPCLDTFINLNAATGLSFQLPDGRWQLPALVVVDSGATFGVGWADAARDIGLRYSPSPVSLVLADGTKSGIAGLSDPVKLVFARGTAAERTITYRFIILEGKGQYYNWLIGKNALLELGAYVDPAESAFVYRQPQGMHKLPVRCMIPAEEAAPTDCLYTLQPMLAMLHPTFVPAAQAAGPLSS